MAKTPKTKLCRWRIILVRHKRADGTVESAGAETAIKAAAEQFGYEAVAPNRAAA